MVKLLLIILVPLSAAAQLPDSTITDLVVSHRKTHDDYLYIGIPNPVEIVVPGIQCGAFDVTCTGGVLIGDGCTYVITPDLTKDYGPLVLNVQWFVDKEQRTASVLFRLRNVPAPTAHFAGLGVEDDTISVSYAKAGAGLVVAIRDQRLDDIGYRHSRFQVEQYRLTITRKCETIFEGRSNEAALSPEMKASLQQVLQGDMILFSGIRYFIDSELVQLDNPIRLVVR